MKKLFLALLVITLSIISLPAQDENDKGTLGSKHIEDRGKVLDKQIVELNKKIAELISSSNLIKIDVKTIPYQSTYQVKQDRIELETHSFVKDEVYPNKITGIKRKIIKVYTDGKNISKIETVLYDRNYENGDSTVVKIVDSTPMDESTDDIKFTHIINVKIEKDSNGDEKYNGRILLEDKQLGQIKNNKAFPLRNEIKSEFVVPHLTLVYSSFLFITESHYKALKDADGYIAEFLKKSVDN